VSGASPSHLWGLQKQILQFQEDGG
jgi:hypothetical protein